MQIEAVVFLVLIVLAFGGALIWLWQQNRQELGGLQTLATDRGWRLEHKLPSGGKGKHWTLTPRDDSWTVTITRFQGENGASSVRTTEWFDSRTVNAAGVVAIGPGLDGAEAGMAGALLGSLDSPIGAMLLKAVFGAEASEMAGLRAIPSPVPGLSVFASEGAADGLNLAAVGRAMQQWSAGRSGKQAEPIAIFGAQGLRLRLRQDVTDARTLGSFVDLALQVRALAKP